MILDGKELSKKMRLNLKEEINNIDSKLRLEIIQVGENKASERYIKQKEKAALELGVECNTSWLDEDTNEEELLELIDKFNKDEKVNGIIVQLPIPKHIRFDIVRNYIDPKKDIDGMHDNNIGKLITNMPCLVPCTSLGVIDLLDEYNIDLEGKNVCIIGRSIHIGKSLFGLLINRDATVTLTHSKTKNLKSITKNSDIVITAVGKSNFITSDMLKKDCILIDIGFNFVDGKLCGDANYEDVKDICSFITPVPGGVGPMTVTEIFNNLIQAYYIQK